MTMTATRTRDVMLPTRVFAEAYKLVHGIEDKILENYPGAEFDLLCGPDEVLHLKVYTPQGALTDLLDLVEEDLMLLEDTQDLTLYVIPLRLEDREDCTQGDQRVRESVTAGS